MVEEEGESTRCPSCGGELGADGICAACLLGIGLGSQGDSPYKFDPPDPSELHELIEDTEIIGLIGRGGMGAVYRGRQKTLGRDVAVKILPAEAFGGQEEAALNRFMIEARALARLDHPNIVRVYGFGQADGIAYLIMELVEGADLGAVIKGGDIAPAEALHMIPQICEGLDYAHRAGVIHRDIKPANILVAADGTVKLADFGLAKLTGETHPEVSLTGDGQVVGTARYMAPEQSGPGKADPRSDIYSLGVVFYELLTGQLPVGHFELPSKLSPVDMRLDDVVLRAIATHPDGRYQSATEILTDLEGILSDHPDDRPWRMTRRTVTLLDTLWWIAGAMALLAAAPGWARTQMAEFHLFYRHLHEHAACVITIIATGIFLIPMAIWGHARLRLIGGRSLPARIPSPPLLRAQPGEIALGMFNLLAATACTVIPAFVTAHCLRVFFEGTPNRRFSNERVSLWHWDGKFSSLMIGDSYEYYKTTFFPITEPLFLIAIVSLCCGGIGALGLRLLLGSTPGRRSPTSTRHGGP